MCAAATANLFERGDDTGRRRKPRVEHIGVDDGVTAFEASNSTPMASKKRTAVVTGIQVAGRVHNRR